MSACAKTPHQQSTCILPWHIKTDVGRAKEGTFLPFEMCGERHQFNFCWSRYVITSHQKKKKWFPLQCVQKERLKPAFGGGTLQKRTSHSGALLPKLCQGFSLWFWDRLYGQAFCSSAKKAMSFCFIFVKRGKVLLHFRQLSLFTDVLLGL